MQTESQVTYTPGPWRVRSASLTFSEGVYGPKIHGQDRNWVADTSVGTANERAANAQLIAAAPELLEACIAAEANLSPLYCSDHFVMRALRAAIAKAEVR